MNLHQSKIFILIFLFILYLLTSQTEAVPALFYSSRKGTHLISHMPSKQESTWNHTLSLIPRSVRNGMASGMAAAVVKTILQPFDTVKTVQQAQRLRIGPINAMKDVIRTRGVTGLWSGLGVTVIGSAPSVAVYFGMYSSCKEYFAPKFGDKYKLAAVALSACIGNTIASILRVPYEVIKQRMQYGLHNSAFEAIRHSFVHEGPLGMFTSGKLASQIVRDVPYAMVTLVSYEILQTHFAKRARRKEGGEEAKASTPISDAICGATAGGIGTIVTQPMDVIKTRAMTTKQYKSVTEAAVRILKEEGIKTFFVGTYPRLLHKIPANGLFFLCYEAFKKLLGTEDELR